MSWILVVLGCSSLPTRTPSEAAPRAPARSSIGPVGPPVSIVNCNGGADHTTIQGAIDAAPLDGWIQVEACTYPETLDYRGKSLWISGVAGGTVLDANNGVAVTVTHGEADGAALVNIDITDASTALDVEHSAFRLQNLTISDSGSTYVVQAEGADLELDGVTIDATNDALTAALDFDRGAMSMTRSTVACGAAGIGVRHGHGALYIDWSTISCPDSNDETLETENTVGRVQRSIFNGKVVIVQEDDHPEDRIIFENTRFTDDIEQTWGSIVLKNSVVNGGTLTLTDVDGPSEVVSSVFVGGGCAIGTNLPIAVRNTDFWNTVSQCAGGADLVGIDGNFSADPLWVDPIAGDYTPGVGSPLIDAGDTDVWSNDVDGSRNDVGITGGKYTTLGGW